MKNCKAEIPTFYRKFILLPHCGKMDLKERYTEAVAASGYHEAFAETQQALDTFIAQEVKFLHAACGKIIKPEKWKAIQELSSAVQSERESTKDDKQSQGCERIPALKDLVPQLEVLSVMPTSQPNIWEQRKRNSAFGSVCSPKHAVEQPEISVFAHHPSPTQDPFTTVPEKVDPQNEQECSDTNSDSCEDPRDPQALPPHLYFKVRHHSRRKHSAFRPHTIPPKSSCRPSSSKSSESTGLGSKEVRYVQTQKSNFNERTSQPNSAHLAQSSSSRDHAKIDRSKREQEQHRDQQRYDQEQRDYERRQRERGSHRY